MATCNAGHGCTITCQNGCGAIYVEPNGPCTTWCEGEATLDIGPKDRFSVQISEMAPGRLINIFSKLIEREVINELDGYRSPVSFSAQNVSLAEFSAKLRESIRQ